MREFLYLLNNITEETLPTANAIKSLHRVFGYNLQPYVDNIFVANATTESLHLNKIYYNG